MTEPITRAGGIRLKKAVEVLEPIKYVQMLVREADAVKTAEGRLNEDIEREAGYHWRECFEVVRNTGKIDFGTPYPVGYYDAPSRGSDGSIGRYSEEDLLMKTLDLTAVKVYVELTRRAKSHDKDLLEGMKQIKFTIDYVRGIMATSEKLAKQIKKGIKNYVGSMMAGECHSRSGAVDYAYSEELGDLEKSQVGEAPPTRSGSVQLKKAAGVQRGGKYKRRVATGDPKRPYRYIYDEPTEGKPATTEKVGEAELKNAVKNTLDTYVAPVSKDKREYADMLSKIPEKQKKAEGVTAEDATSANRQAENWEWMARNLKSPRQKPNAILTMFRAKMQGSQSYAKKTHNPSSARTDANTTANDIKDVLGHIGKPLSAIQEGHPTEPRKSEFDADDLRKSAEA